MTYESEFAHLHKELGCEDCYFADKSSIGKKECCTHAFRINVDPSTGKCLTRRVTTVSEGRYKLAKED
jgi:hypothetical protein